MASTSTAEDDPVSFSDMGLDDRILKAIAKLGWTEPTPIQEKAIPLSLEGKDVLARARTGSGKTAAFAIPVVQKLLLAKQTATEQAVRAIVLTPARELCLQAYKKIMEVSSCCSREIKCVDISPQASLQSQRPLLAEKPDIVVGTPSRILAHLRAGHLELHAVQMVVVDEADLVFSFGYETDIKKLLEDLPRIYQAFLMSATLSEDVKALKKMVLHNPVILKLKESQLPEAAQLTQYYIKCDIDDKFTLLVALLKLGLVRGKTILFVNSVDSCYKLKLFLEPFGIPSCVLNAELPVKSRCHIVSQFNEGLYELIIASDENLLEKPNSKPNSKGKTSRKKDEEYGVARGIDFKNISNVINFEFPKSVDAYIHRVGRTARGDQQGCALSFVGLQENNMFDAVDSAQKAQEDSPSVFTPFHFNMKEVETFKYRAMDAMKAVTRTAVREARLKEIRQEILASEKLKTYFEDNPRDLQVLRHNKALGTTRMPQTLKHVPDYAVPEALKSVSRRQRKRRGKAKTSETTERAPTTAQAKFKKRKADPLKSFEFAGFSKKKRK
ncbi:putative ATP-dependent RNA helicase DDX56 [Babylonia areolata]|uniref:putative ATP-dependent RNA helicase DDX56 n=1 Tax=Babylonia areolata TaxID=304850 RepID=UPI003FD3D8F4